MTEAGAYWGAMYGLEIPIYFAEDGFRGGADPETL